jgi:FecR-like protein
MLGCCRSFFGVLIYASHRFFFNFLTLRTAMSARVIALCLVSICLFESATLAWAQTNAPQSSPIADANPVGKVMTVGGSAHIQHVTGAVVQANLPASGNGDAKIGDLVYRGDMIQTGVDGALGITFVDGSSFSFSSNARMEVNEFVYDPHGDSNLTLISLTQGTFNFIAGSIAKTGDMKIDTPVGTVGIRGTAPRIEILNDGSVKFTTMMEKK